MPQCPHCGSYNTKTVVAAELGNFAVIVGRGAIALGAFGAALTFSPKHAHILAHKAFEASDPGKIPENYCRNCKKYF